MPTSYKTYKRLNIFLSDEETKYKVEEPFETNNEARTPIQEMEYMGELRKHPNGVKSWCLDLPCLETAQGEETDAMG